MVSIRHCQCRDASSIPARRTMGCRCYGSILGSYPTRTGSNSLATHLVINKGNIMNCVHLFAFPLSIATIISLVVIVHPLCIMLLVPLAVCMMCYEAYLC